MAQASQFQIIGRIVDDVIFVDSVSKNGNNYSKASDEFVQLVDQVVSSLKPEPAPVFSIDFSDSNKESAALQQIVTALKDATIVVTESKDAEKVVVSSEVSSVTVTELVKEPSKDVSNDAKNKNKNKK